MTDAAPADRPADELPDEDLIDDAGDLVGAPALTQAEARAYADLLTWTREHHRLPHAHEAWPHVRHLERFRGRDLAGEREGSEHGRVSRGKVFRYVRRLLERGAAASGSCAIVRAATIELAAHALEVARDCLGDKYDADPKLLAEKRQLAVALLRLAGVGSFEEESAEAPRSGRRVHLSIAPPAELRHLYGRRHGSAG